MRCASTTCATTIAPMRATCRWRLGANAHAKLSAYSLLGNPRSLERVRAVVSELLELFGPQRCMVGSNFPVERLAGGFGSWYELTLGTLAELSDEQRADVLSGTARRFYRLTGP